MKVAVFGNFGVQNLGDDLILQGLQSVFAQQQAELLVFSGHPERVQEQFGLKAFAFFPGGVRSRLRSLTSSAYRQQVHEAQKALQSADLVVIGGGGILVDRHPKAVALWLSQLRQIAKSNKPYHFLGNSFELNRPTAVRLFKPFLMQAEQVTVRDKASQAWMSELGRAVELVDDFAYQVPLDLQRVDQPSKTICLALCRWGLGASQRAALRGFINQRRSEGYRVVGLAFQTLGDDDRKLYRQLDPELEVLEGLEDIGAALASCELLVGMRLHSLILADRLSVPTIAIAYQQKVASFMRDKGKEALTVAVENLDGAKLQLLFEKAVAGKSQ